MAATHHCTQRDAGELSKADIDVGFRNAMLSIYGGHEQALDKYLSGIPVVPKEPCRYIPRGIKYHVDVWPRLWSKQYGDMDAALCRCLHEDGLFGYEVILKYGLTETRWLELMQAIGQASDILWNYDVGGKFKTSNCPFCGKTYKTHGPFVRHIVHACLPDAKGVGYPPNYNTFRKESMARRREDLKKQKHLDVFDSSYDQDDQDDDLSSPCVA